MAWIDLTIQKQLIQGRGVQQAVDSNNDGNNEAYRISPDVEIYSNYFIEEFDFDSNGATDYSRYVSDGKTKFESFYSNNPEGNELVEDLNEADKFALRFKAAELQGELDAVPKTKAKSIYEPMAEALKASREERESLAEKPLKSPQEVVAGAVQDIEAALDEALRLRFIEETTYSELQIYQEALSEEVQLSLIYE